MRKAKLPKMSCYATMYMYVLPIRLLVLQWLWCYLNVVIPHAQRQFMRNKRVIRFQTSYHVLLYHLWIIRLAVLALLLANTLLFLIEETAGKHG